MCILKRKVWVNVGELQIEHFECNPYATENGVLLYHVKYQILLYYILTISPRSNAWCHCSCTTTDKKKYSGNSNLYCRHTVNLNIQKHSTQSDKLLLARPSKF